MSELPNNLRRLLGMHALTAAKASGLLGISQQALSELQLGKRESPRASTVKRLGEFFEVPYWKLQDTPFDELLAEELASPERFNAVEAKIAAGTPPGDV